VRRGTVRDHGIGIPSQDVERIFSQFFRARNVGAIAGTGIGLAGAREIVEQHGGRLSAASREGRGTTFTLQLPIADGTSAASQQ
jgi:signal transduction histidine kinase